jgi:mannan endo-1,6-alpha-mannosidase
MMSYFAGNTTVDGAGALPYPPYYWWETGAMLGVIVNYWSATGDSTYNNQTSASILAQIGADKDFEPAAQYFDMGNDDQAFWAMTALTAAETNFPDPTDKTVSWLGLAQAVFNEQILRWDNTTCGGGLHWQVFQSGGYHLKNSISNGGLMQIAARLARYTKDDMYAEWATKIWDWMWAVKLIDNVNYSVYDNADSADPLNCTQIDRSQWTYNAGTVLVSAATMYNYVSTSFPRTRSRLTDARRVTKYGWTGPTSSSRPSYLTSSPTAS